MSTEDNSANDFEFIIFDLETTGLDVEKDRIVELYALSVSNGKKFHCYIMPPGRSKIGGTEFHGLTRDILKKKDAKDTKSSLKQFLSWIYRDISLGKPLCFVAHNNFGYDQLILENEYARHDIEMINCFYADSCPMFKDSGKFANAKLGTIYDTIFKKKLENAHTAEADVDALYACLQTYPDWTDNIPVRVATYRVDDSDFGWIDWMLKDKQLEELKKYGYTSVAKMVEGANRHGATFKNVLTEMFGDWFGDRLYTQLRHVIRHQIKQDPHEYSTRSKFPTGI